MEKYAETDTIKLFLYRNNPKDIISTYSRAVRDIRPKKLENHRTKVTAGIKLIGYPGELSAPTSDLTIMKINVNSDIFNIKMRYMYMDVKDSYLVILMDRADLIMIHISMIPK